MLLWRPTLLQLKTAICQQEHGFLGPEAYMKCSSGDLERLFSFLQTRDSTLPCSSKLQGFPFLAVYPHHVPQLLTFLSDPSSS